LVRRTLTAALRAFRIVCLAALVLAAFSLTNLVYHVVRKPSELLFFVGGALDKGTDRNVAAVRAALPHVFHQHDHARAAGRAGAGRKHRQSGGAHLLALAAHLESLRRVQAASSAVGMYQMTDAAYAEAARYCRLLGITRFSRMRRLAPFFKLRVKSIRSKDLMAIYIGSSYVWPRPARGIPRSGECAWATYRFLHGV
jgi:hypothetical protein